MELVIGGAYQGKLEYILDTTSYTNEDVYDASIFYQEIKLQKEDLKESEIIEKSNTISTFPPYMLSLDVLYKKPILNQFHLFIKGLLELKIDPYPIVFELMSKHKDLIIIADEIGSGVVPMLSFDREYRETVGRLLCLIAKNSDKVHRVILGIGTIIKK